MGQNLNICSQKVSIVDEKCENLLFEWAVQIGKVIMSIFFEITVADGKSEHLSFIFWYLRWQSPCPLSYPLLLVHFILWYGIKYQVVGSSP